MLQGQGYPFPLSDLPSSLFPGLSIQLSAIPQVPLSSPVPGLALRSAHRLAWNPRAGSSACQGRAMGGAPHLSKGLGVGSNHGRRPSASSPWRSHPPACVWIPPEVRSTAQETQSLWGAWAGRGEQGRSVLSLEGSPPPPSREQWDFPDLEATLPLLFMRLDTATRLGFFFGNRSALLKFVAATRSPSLLPSGAPCPQCPHRRRARGPARGPAWHRPAAGTLSRRPQNGL